MARINAYRTADNEYMDLHAQNTIDFLRQQYPAVMAQGYASNLSPDYQFQSTYDAAVKLQDRFGLRLVYASQQWSKRRDPNFQEHVLRFQFPDVGPIQLRNVGDSHPELVLANSHNGRSAIKFYAGIFRLACSNGMVVADADFGKVKIRHFGNDALGKFSNLIDDTARRMAVLDARIKKMQELVLRPLDQFALARLMMAARKAPGWLLPEMVLEARRPEDEKTDDGHRSLWTTFNVLQENLSNHDIRFEQEGRRPGFMRPITGSMRDLALNEGLWLKLEEFIGERFPDISRETIEGELTTGFLPAPEDQDAPTPEAEPVPYDQIADVAAAEATAAVIEVATKPKRVRTRKQKEVVEA